MTNRYVLYHANCPDGFGAALAAWKKLGDEATYVPVRYNQPPPKIYPPAVIYILDFSYPLDVMLDFHTTLDSQSLVVVVDHHKTAENTLAELKDNPLFSIRFDMKESGATLAWFYFTGDLHGLTIPPLLYRYLRDRDLWEWKLPGSKEFSAALASYPKSFKLWDSFTAPGEPERLIDEGRAILRYQNKMVDALCKNAELNELEGHRIMAVNTPLLGSEIGDKLCDDHPDIDFAMCYSRQGDGMWRHELRSIGDFDVSAVAKVHGGGGHKNAAGFISAERGIE